MAANTHGAKRIDASNARRAVPPSRTSRNSESTCDDVCCDSGVENVFVGCLFYVELEKGGRQNKQPYSNTYIYVNSFFRSACCLPLSVRRYWF